mmetsp:Transcript_39178/g.73036  ORF Transcript_39178/g.73036 Transcript_39178/m.73036 type:complete len:478 (-) Transcript_39178:10-1443(-)
MSRSRSRSPPGRSEAVTVQVKLLSGQTLATLQVHADDSVAEIRQRVEEIDAELRGSFPRSALMFGDRELLPSDIAGDVGLHEGALLTLIRLPPQKLCTASEDGTARIFELHSGKTLCILGGHCGAVSSVTFSEDGSRALTMTATRSIALYNTTLGAQLWRLQGPVQDACLAADGRRVLVMDSHSVVGLLDATTGQVMTNLTHHAYYVCTAVFSPGGKALLTASVEGFARLFDVESGRCLITFESKARSPSGRSVGMSAAAFSPDASKVLVSIFDGSADLYDRYTGERICTCVGHSDALRCATMTPDGSQILTASKDGTAKLFCAKTGTCLSTFGGHTKPLCAANFSPDLSKVLTASQDSSARLYDAKTGVCLQSFPGHSAPVLGASLSTDGTLVLTCSSDLDAKLFDSKTGECLRSFCEENGRPENGYVTCAQWAPGGQQVLLAFFSGRVALFDPKQHRFVQEFPGHTDCVHSMKLV